MFRGALDSMEGDLASTLIIDGQSYVQYNDLNSLNS